MNKKIFAALASATMALSATGSLAVFAEDFDTVTEAESNNGTASGIVITGNKVAVNETNFPDDGFRQMIINGDVVTGLPADFKYGDSITKDQINDVKDITLNADVVNPKGIELFTNLEILTCNNSSKLTTLDLSSNKKLKELTLDNVSKLATLTLPETNTLNKVIVDGGTAAAPNTGTKAPITVLDFSGNKGLTDVTVNNTDVMKLDLSKNAYLTDANVDNNKLFSLDLTDNFALKSVSVVNNNLYSLDVPNTNRTTYLNASYNILQEIDLTGLTGVETLALNNNELRSIDLSPVANSATLINLQSNHIGALDDQGNSHVNATPQIVYVDASFNGVNLKDTFDGFETSAATVNATSSSAAKKLNKNGVLELTGDQTWYTYETGKSAAMQVAVVNNVNVLNRLYNPNSGEHFYTSDVEEKDALVKLGWKDEGTGWVSPKESTVPVYRLYNPNAGDHHYTKSSSERDILVSVGWKNEGTGWYSYIPTSNYNVWDYNGAAGLGTGTIASIDVVREYNPNAKAAGSHNYTINRAENDFLVSVGWLDEGIAWQSLK
ncbi:hypothetical protein IM774_04605 [Erysipelotrichaceae bacterium RD49]|nr:hypothetical protein [Erysipelotrichaceae bacterium RD49]